MNGWIKLHRELIDKPIWLNSSLEQRIILITLLCMVNHKPMQWEWKGTIYTVQAGQFITSAQSIIDKCKCKEITRQKVRTALARFEKLGFLTIETTKQNSLITIVNWEKYQGLEGDDNQVDNQHLTNGQPTLNQHLTTNEECKNIKNNKNDNNINLSINHNTPPTPSPTPTPTPNDRIDRIDTDFIQRLKNNISYDDLCYTHNKGDIDNIINLAYDLIAISDKVIHIGNKSYAHDYVRDILLTLNFSKVEFLLMKRNEMGKDGNIRNPKRYFQSCIFSTALNYETEWNEFFNRSYYGSLMNGGD